MSTNKPNKLPEGSLILTGGVDLLTSTLPLILAIRKMLADKDIGEFVGETLLDSAKRVSSDHMLLTIVFSSNQKPPFFVGKHVRATYNIPNLKRSSLKWDIIKAACGGKNGYVWGRWRATANLSSGRQLQIYGGSDKEAQDRLLALHELSDTKITTLSCSEEIRTGLRAKGKLLEKETTRIYPVYATIINTEKVKSESQRELDAIKRQQAQKVPTTQGLFKRKKVSRIPLWQDKAPSWFDAEVNEAFVNRGTTKG